LSLAAAEAIRNSAQNGGLAISAMTIWELAWLATHARLNLKEPVDTFVEELTSRTAIRPITPRIAILGNQLPVTYPSDPCDRLIGGTALAEGIPLVTKDRSIRNCRQIKTIW
jgi:PIN domain nuclease of toxin-antitoxin system